MSHEECIDPYEVKFEMGALVEVFSDDETETFRIRGVSLSRNAITKALRCSCSAKTSRPENK